MINISWNHEAAQAEAFASLLPKAIEAIDRWAYVDGSMQTDEFGPYYDVITRGEKTNIYHKVLRPATLRLGAMKALQEAPDHWVGHLSSILQIFENIASGGDVRDGKMFHDPSFWRPQTLDFMVQLAMFREVTFA